MDININTYRKNHLPLIPQFVGRQTQKQTIIELMQRYTSINGMPIIAVCHLFCEIYGEDPTLLKKMQVIIDFYKLTSFTSDVRLEAFDGFYKEQKEQK